jgi:hypothetical protein
MSAIRRKVQADEIEANRILGLKAIGGFLEVGQFCNAGSAPRRPEVEHIESVGSMEVFFEVLPGELGKLGGE